MREPSAEFQAPLPHLHDGMFLPPGLLLHLPFHLQKRVFPEAFPMGRLGPGLGPNLARYIINTLFICILGCAAL